MLVQACQVASPIQGNSSYDPAPVQLSDKDRNQHITLLRPETVLLLATVRGGKAKRGAFTGAMADEFREADGKKDIGYMFDSAVYKLKQDPDCESICQCPEFRKTTSKVLIMPR